MCMILASGLAVWEYPADLVVAQIVATTKSFPTGTAAAALTAVGLVAALTTEGSMIEALGVAALVASLTAAVC